MRGYDGHHVHTFTAQSSLIYQSTIIYLVGIALLFIGLVTSLSQHHSTSKTASYSTAELNVSARPAQLLAKPLIFSESTPLPTITSSANDSKTSPSVSTTQSTLRVNGTSIKVTPESHTEKTIRSNGNKTTVDISVNSRSSSSTDSSLDISIQSNSETVKEHD